MFSSLGQKLKKFITLNKHISQIVSYNLGMVFYVLNAYKIDKHDKEEY